MSSALQPPPEGDIELFERQYPELGKWIRLLSGVLDPKAWREISDAAGKNPIFGGSWDNYGSGYATAAFYRDAFNRVWLKGSLNTGTSGTTVFTLPVGYRPPLAVTYPISGNAGGGGHGDINALLEVQADGDVVITFSGGGGATRLSMDGISWRI